MSILGTLFNSSQAMITHSHALDTTSQNIANVNTTAYKRVETNFKDLMMATHPRWDSFSVDAVDRRLVDQAGFLEETGRSRDLALVGEGFFIVSDGFGSDDILFTRDGNFRGVARDSVTNPGTEDVHLTTTGGQFLLGWQANADGSFTTADSLANLVPVRVNTDSIIDAQPTTTVSIGANIPADSTLESERVSTPVFDQSGTSQTMSLLWTKTGSNQWDLNLSVTDGSIASPATAVPVVFQSNGDILGPTSTEVVVDWLDGSQSTIDLDFSETTQYAGPNTIYRLDQDGSAAAPLVRTFVDGDGIIYGSYSNGVVLPQYKLAIADFQVPNELEALSGNIFARTEAAGGMTVMDLEAQGVRTSIEEGFLEASNVDLADEFTRMLTTQKAYSSAATVFRTGDQMMQEAANLKR